MVYVLPLACFLSHLIILSLLTATQRRRERIRQLKRERRRPLIEERRSSEESNDGWYTKHANILWKTILCGQHSMSPNITLCFSCQKEAQPTPKQHCVPRRHHWGSQEQTEHLCHLDLLMNQSPALAASANISPSPSTRSAVYWPKVDPKSPPRRNMSSDVSLMGQLRTSTKTVEGDGEIVTLQHK